MSEQHILSILDELGANATAARMDDPSTLMNLGVTIERAIEAVADKNLLMNQLLRQSLDLLRECFEARAGADALAAVVSAVDVAGEYAKDNNDGAAFARCRAAIEAMASANALAAASQPSPSQPIATPEPAGSTQPAAEFTVADIVARLLAVSDTDKPEIAAILQSIQGASDAGSASPGLRQIASCLQKALDGPADTAGKHLQDAIAAAGAFDEQSGSADEVQAAPPVLLAPVEPSPEPASTEWIVPPETDPDLLKEYVAECLDHVTAAEAALLAMETCPEDTEQVNTVFRAFHTIKGTSGMLGLTPIQTLAHRAENLLDQVRQGTVHLSGSIADLALKSCDILHGLIEPLRQSAPGQASAMPTEYAGLMTQLASPCSDDEQPRDRAMLRVGDILVARGQAPRQQVEDVATSGAERPLGAALVKAGVAKVSEVAEALRTQRQIASAPAQASAPSSADPTVRIGTQRLDSMIDLVGELVIAHSMVSQDPRVTAGSEPRLSRNVAHAAKILRELQDLTMSLRMVPLKGTFQKMTRLVRDLARGAGKDIQLVTQGEDTEIDRGMVESLNDPLVHMIRNAVDHGIESPQDRIAAGKTPAGTIHLRAYHSAGSVIIQVQDDGKGLDRRRILAKAIERGCAKPQDELTDSQVFNLIFLPGFSTAEKVTDVSGRGVGMDVVRRNIDSIRGRIDIGSRLGEGTLFTLHLPLTMAITDAMVVAVGRQRYLLPTISIIQSFRPEAASLSTVGGRGEMVMLRGQLMPMLRLHRLFGVQGAVEQPVEGLLIVVQAEGRTCALLVDELLGQQQVVIKSLSQSMGSIPGVSGGAILGDGRVGLILDAAGVVKMALGQIERAAA